MKRKVVLFALISLLILQCLIGCQPNTNTPQPSETVSAEPTPVTKEEDGKTVIATVNGVPLYKADFLVQFNRAVITYQLQEYDFTQDTEDVAELKSTLINDVYESLIAVEVCRQAAEKAGFTTLTEAEKAQAYPACRTAGVRRNYRSRGRL